MNTEKTDLFVLTKLRILVKKCSKIHLTLKFITLQQYLRSASACNRLYLRNCKLIHFKNSEVY